MGEKGKEGKERGRHKYGERERRRESLRKRGCSRDGFGGKDREGRS